MQRIYVLCCLLAILITGCRNDCKQKYLPESYKPYQFKTGSYWVYKDSAYGTYDTLYLEDLRAEIIEGNTPVKCKGEALTEVYMATVVKGYDTITCYTNTMVGFEVLSSAFDVQGNVLDPELANGGCNASDMCVEDIGTMNIGGNSFNSVRKFHTQLFHYSSGPFCMADFYWCPNIGPVKIALNNASQTTIELQQWHIVQ